MPTIIESRSARSSGSATGFIPPSKASAKQRQCDQLEAFVLSDPGEMNFWPDYDTSELEGLIESMANLTEHWSFQNGQCSTRPSKDWAESVRDIVAALHSTQDDDIRGDIAVCIGQQTEEVRLAFVQAQACAALVKALTSQDCINALHRIDFSLRSLARHPIGRERASAALMDALKIAESSVTNLANAELSDGFSMNGLVYAIGKFAQNEDNRCALLQAGAFPLLVASAGFANDDELNNLFCDAISTLSRDAVNHVPFIRNLFQHVLSIKCPRPAFANASAQQIQLNRMLQDFSRHFEEALASAGGAQLAIPVAHGFVGRLLMALNLHLQIRSDLLHVNKDRFKGLGKAITANTVVGSCLRFLGVLLSKNEAHESNFNKGLSSVFSGIFNELDKDAYDPWSSTSFLNPVSRCVIAVKLPGSAWNVTVDCKAQPDALGSLSARSSRYARKNRTSDVDGSSALIAPLQEYADAAAVAAASGSCHFNDALCAVCQCSLFEIKKDGSIVVIARQLKCFESKHEQTAGVACTCMPFPLTTSILILHSSRPSGSLTFCTLIVQSASSFSTVVLNAPYVGKMGCLFSSTLFLCSRVCNGNSRVSFFKGILLGTKSNLQWLPLWTTKFSKVAMCNGSVVWIIDSRLFRD